jgi:acyl transferase domain-containing protein/phosphopantetheinyl transferase
MANNQDIAIVGMACVFPKAADLRQYWSNLVNGVDAVTDRPPHRWREHANFDLPPEHEAAIPVGRGGYLPAEIFFDPVAYGVLPNLVRHGDPDQFLMLHLADKALRDAQVAADAPVRERTDVIIGRGGYPTGKLAEMELRADIIHTVVELIDRRFPDWTAAGRRDELERYLRSTLTDRESDHFSTGISNLTASRTANRLNLRGAAYVVDAACASSLLAVEQAVWRLRNGLCDMALAGGLFLSLSPTFLSIFTQLSALSATGMSRPFDRRADGLLAGEGGGAVTLKRLEDAVRDGDQVYAIIKGVGSSSDGREVDVLAPSAKGQLKALQAAYADADVDRDTIGLLEAHGTGTLVGDQVEIATIKEFFGAVPTPATGRAMGSVKSMIGHCMPAAGVAGLIKATLALSNKIIPPTLHCEEPHPDLADAPFYIATQTRPWIHNPAQGPRRAGVSAFGFGGINAHVVLEEVQVADPRSNRRSFALINGNGHRESAEVQPRPIEVGLTRPSELVIFAAKSREKLVGQLQRLEHFLDQDQTGATLADVAWSLAGDALPEQPVKLALIAVDLPELRQLARQAAEQLVKAGPYPAAENVYFADNAAQHDGKVAFIFPGVGFPGLIGNYPDHLMELCLHYPEARAEFDFFEDRDRHPEDQVPTSAIFSPPPTLPEAYRKQLKARLSPPKVDEMTGHKTLPHERYLAAMGVTLSNWMGWVLLRKFHIPVDMVTGQSQGEMAALCAAGVSDFHQAAPSFWKVVNVDPRDTRGSRMAFAWASAEEMEPLMAANPGTHVAIHLGPHAVIFGGEREACLRIADKLREDQVLVQLLPFPPIHTPCLSHLRHELLEQLRDEEFHLEKPRIGLYSSITAEKYPDDPEGIRATLLRNIDEPLRLWQTVQRLYADGARIFVQVGGGHMANHLETILPEGAPVVTAALDADTQNPLTQLNRLCATLFTAGVPLDCAPLYTYRRVRTLNLDAPQPAPTRTGLAIPLRIDWSPLYHSNVPPRRAEAVVEEKPQQPALADEPEPEPVVVPEPGLPRLPVLGQLTHFVPEQELVIERRLDLAEDLYLQDHLFVFAEFKPMTERLPILPLTMSMEFLAEAASLLTPALGLIGFENVHGNRWVGLRDCTTTDLRIEARLRSVDPETGVRRVEGTLFYEGKPSFSATVLMAAEYRQDIDFQLADSSGDGPWPYRLEQVYGDRLMFHGPAFQVISGLGTLGNPGASATLTVPPKDRLFASTSEPALLTDPCVMDGVGQVFGLWTMAHDFYIMPIEVEKVEFYGPTPPVGTALPVRMEVLDFDLTLKKFRGNLEIGDGQGGVLARVAGWGDWIMGWSKKYCDCIRLPTGYLLADELALPGLPAGSVCTMTVRQDLAAADPDWGARILLSSAEFTEFRQLEAGRKRHVLGARMAVKDAARLWLARQTGTPLRHPGELTVTHDDLGRPYLKAVDIPGLPQVSLAHVDGVAVALAADVPVGIDVERVADDRRDILPYVATDAERELIETLAANYPEDAWETRLWCAKEAVAKALGTGLQGRPKDFEAIAAEPDGSLLLQHAASQQRFVVRSARLDALMLAYTSIQA